MGACVRDIERNCLFGQKNAILVVPDTNPIFFITLRCDKGSPVKPCSNIIKSHNARTHRAIIIIKGPFIVPKQDSDSME